MITLSKITKSIWKKPLYEGLDLLILPKEKSALIGRNGTGKTTLFRLINGEDKDFEGTISRVQGIKIVTTKQEHNFPEKITPLEYILNEVPHYNELRKLVFTENAYTKNPDKYLEAMQTYTDLNYFHIEDQIIQSLKDFQIPEERSLEDMRSLSGGEKRFVELVRIMYSGADLALIDEPTNHMDYIGKEKFITWLKNLDHACIVITHDRDVLQVVDNIYELNGLSVKKYSGNYDKYLRQNSMDNISAINQYEVASKEAEKLRAKVKEIEQIGSISHALKIRLLRFRKQLEIAEAKAEKPEFWIDQDTLNMTSEKLVDKYNKFKQVNIKIAKSEQITTHKKSLFRVNNLSLGYSAPVFSNMTFDLFETDRIQLVGRNGAGKTTLLKYLIATIENKSTVAKKFDGEIKVTNAVKLGVYEQEPSEEFMPLTLAEAIFKVYEDEGKPIGKPQLLATLDTYLFDKVLHIDTKVSQLSGGEKARFQLIKMLASKPNMLILDEPTNHLDLPSIEELEKFVKSFTGAIIYVSHDSYFVKAVGGKELRIVKE